MNDQRDEALRLAKEAGLSCNDYGQIYASGSGAVLIEDIVDLIALARASAAPQEPVTWGDFGYFPEDRVAELEEHLTQAIMGRQFHYERAEKAESLVAELTIERDQLIRSLTAADEDCRRADDALADARDKALEEAAQVAELELMAWGPGAAYSNQSIESAAKAIRALRTNSEK